MTNLVNGLGGSAGFGEFTLPRNDDGSTSFINLTSVFGSQGINFFGHYYTGLYLNNNGSVTFNSATSAFTPSAITGATNNPSSPPSGPTSTRVAAPPAPRRAARRPA